MTEVLVNIEQVPKVDVQQDTAASQLPIHLLVVVGQTYGKNEKREVLNRLNSSLVSIGDSLLSLREDLNTAVQSQFDSVKFDQENRIIYNNETSLQLDILINSTGKTLRKALRDFLLSNSKNKHFISATLDLNSNGDFNLQDSLFSYDNLNTLLNEPEVKKSLLNTENSIKFHLNSKLVELNKSWKSLEKQHKNIHIVTSQSLPEAARNYSEFLTGLDNLLNETPIDSLMETSKTVGTLKITRPVLYIFPSREGDAAYFMLNGYSILINGGYDRVKPCFWSFVSMLAQIDSVLITHPDSDALGGLGSFFAKKLVDPDVKPNVLTVLGNLIASSDYTSAPEAAQLAANLIATESATQKGSSNYVDLIIDSINRLKISLMPLVKTNDQPIAKHNAQLNNFSKYEHVNLYFKLGQGSLDLYVLSPFSNSTEYKEFVELQQTHIAKQTHQKSHLSPNQLFKAIPLSHVTSAVVLLVWLPHVTKQTALAGENSALRLLFPGNAPQHVIINALDKVKDFEVLSSPVYKIKPAPEPVVHHKKPVSTKVNTTATNGVKPAVNGNGKSLTTNASKSNLTSKPPMMAKSETKPKSAETKASVPKSAPPKTEETKASVPKSAPPKTEETKASVPKSAPVKTEKKPVPAQVSKKTEPSPAKKQEAKKPESGIKKTEQNNNKPEATNTKADLTPGKKSTNTSAPTASRLSASKAGAPAAAPAPKKTLQPNKSASKINPEVTEEEKKQSRVITKRDPKQSATKPGMSKSASNKSEKTAPVTASVTSAGTESITPSVDNSVDLLGSVDSSVEVAALVVAPVEETSNAAVEEVEVENTEESREDEVADEVQLQRLSSEIQNGNKSESEWPNLSPVKNEMMNGGNTMDSHYMEDRNNSITSNTSGIDMDTEGKERKEINFMISDAKDLIQTPEDETAPSFNVNQDVMTKSFIDDGEETNPFAAKQQQHADDSMNDLNKTHELSDTDGDNTEDNQDLDVLTKDVEIVESKSEEEKAEDDKDEDDKDEDDKAVEEKAEDDKAEEEKAEVEKAEEEKAEDDKAEEFETEDKTEAEEFVEVVKTEGLVEEEVKSEDPECLDDILSGLNGLTLNGATNGHENGTMNGESSLEEGEIRDELSFESSEPKVVPKPCQESISSGVTQPEDPTKWNLLELPKPVNPNDLPVPEKETKAEKKALSPSQDKSKLNNNRSSISSKVSHVQPVYLEVSYIPAHGDSAYVDIDFFRKVRARHYVLSTEEPTEKLLNAMIEAKETWEDKSVQTTIIPTYESEALRHWYLQNEEALVRLRIDITPSATMSTLTMDDNPDMTCQLYKLEL